jgi:hypothetical protein
MPIVQDLQEGQAFQDIPLTPAEQPGALTPEALAAEHAKMRAAFAAKGIEPPPLAPGEKEAVKPADPFAGEKQVDPFHGEQQVHDPFAGERKADALDERTPQDLAADPNFKIHDFVSQNPDVFKDPKRYQKALDTYREQQAQGATLHKTVESVKKDTVPLLKDILKSIPARLENLGEIGGIGKLVNTITMTLRGEGGDPALRAQWENMSEDNKEAAIAEATAGTQTAVGSLQDMVRQGARKLVGPAFGVGGKKDWRTISDEELKNEFFKDLGWKQTVEELSRGEGVKNLVSEGVQLNPENIKLLSLTDPITLVGTGVGLKAVSTGGRILFTAANQAGADAALSYLGRAAGTAAAKTAQAVGQGIEATGQGIKNLLPSSAHGIGTGAFLHMFGVPTKALVAARLAAPVISKTGQLIREVGEAAGAAPKGQLSLGLESTTGAKVLNAAKTAAAFVKPPVVGALEGAATTAPLAFATDEPQGGLLGVGAVGGAVHGAVTGVKGAVAEAGAKRYFDPGQINWEKTSSPGYEGFPGLNAAHEAVSASTPENARNMVDSLRETLRPFGKKLFLVDDASYQKAIEQDTIRANGGQPLTPEQQAAVAQEARSRGVSKINVADDKGNVESVTLVKSSADAPHEFSHVLESVMAPEAREALHDAVREAYTPEELDALKAHYEQQFGRPFTPEEVRSEFIADNWANLLYNTPMESLGLPEAKTTFRQKFLDAAVSMGNALGLDMTAGRKTPGLNLKPSYSLRKALANATGEILAERDQRAAQQATAAPPVQPAEPAPAPAAPVEVPVKPAAEPTAQGELPLFEQPSAPAEATPPASPPAPAPAEATPPAAPSAKRAAVTNTGILTSWSKGKDNEAAVNTVAQAMDQGIGVKMEHAGAPKVTYEPTEPERAAEVEEGRGLPPEQREVHAGEKFLTRAEQTKTGEPQVIARSVDKVVSNIDRAVQWGKAAGETVPWETDANGALTAAGLNQLLADQRTYWDNQDRGFRGGGGKLVRPEGVNVSIPAEKGEGVPLGTEKEQWLNLLQGKDVGPPQTARVVKGQLPANIKAQEIRAAQGDVSERIAPGTNIPIYPEKATQGRGPVEIKETNPLRNRLRAAGMPVGDLHTVVERLNAADIVKAEPAPELQGKGGQTDIARAGYLPEKPVGETVKDVTDATPEQWQKFFGPQGSLTRSAYDLGLGLKDRADLDTLMAAQDAASKTAQATMAEVRAGNFDALDKASADATKAQFFREAIEAATDKGSASGTSGWRKSHPDAKPPFAEGAALAAGFLSEEPLTKAGFTKTEKGWEKEFPIRGGKVQVSLQESKSRRHRQPVLNGTVTLFSDESPEHYSSDSFAAYSKDIGDVVAKLDRTEAIVKAVSEVGQEPNFDSLSGLLSRERPGKRFVTDLEKPAAPEQDKNPMRQFLSPDEMPDEVDPIAQAAIRTKDGKIYTGSWHGEAMDKIAAERGITDADKVMGLYDSGELTDGFVTKKGTFYDRAGAADYATKIKQLKQPLVYDKSLESAEFAGKRAFLSETALEPIRSGEKDGETFNADGSVFVPPTDAKLDVVPLTSINLPADQFTAAGVAKALEPFKETLKNENIKAGVFRLATPDAEGKQQYSVDINALVDQEHRDNSIAFAKANGQEAVFDLAEQQSVATGGNGEAVLKSPAEVAKAAEALARGENPLTPGEADVRPIDDRWHVVWKPRAEGKTTLRQTVHAASAEEAQQKAGVPEGAHIISTEPVYAPGMRRAGFLPSSEPRAIKSAAVQDGDGKIFEGRFHGEAILRADDEGAAAIRGYSDPIWDVPYKTGFVTNEGEFLSRDESFQRAKELEQLPKDFQPLEPGELHTGDLREAGVLPPREPTFISKEDRGGYLPKKGRETEAEAKKRVEETDYSKYNTPAEQKAVDAKATGWILPNGKYVPLDTNYHQTWLGENADKLNKQFGTELTKDATEDDRLAALNAGFVRVRNYGGKMVIEANIDKFDGARRKAINNLVDRHAENVDSIRVSLLDENGEVADSIGEQLHEMSDPRKVAREMLDHLRQFHTPKEETAPKKGPSNIQIARSRGGYLPENIPPQGTPGFNDYAESLVAKAKSFPEVLPPELRRDKAGNVRAAWDGEPLFAAQEWDLFNTPLAKKSGSVDAFTTDLSKKMEEEYNSIKDRPELKGAEQWYELCRTKLREVLKTPEDIKLFGELLGATSPQQKVAPNFSDAVAAFNQIKSGAYDDMVAKYREGKAKFAAKDPEAMADFQKEASASAVKSGQLSDFLYWWADKHDLVPKKANGAKYGMNSRAVMKVLDGTWMESVEGPKTPSFTGNLIGLWFKGIVDKWAMRTMTRLSSEGQPWRIIHQAETGISNPEYFAGEKAFQEAADRIGIKPDALQAILWVNEQRLWEENGWARAGAQHGATYQGLLEHTTKTPEGKLEFTPPKPPKKVKSKVAKIVESQ